MGVRKTQVHTLCQISFATHVIILCFVITILFFAFTILCFFFALLCYPILCLCYSFFPFTIFSYPLSSFVAHAAPLLCINVLVADQLMLGQAVISISETTVSKR